MLRRKIYPRLLEWKKSFRKKALLIAGARQVGKSTIAREFGKNEYETVLEINFIEHPEFIKDFSDRDPEKILFSLSARLNQAITPYTTLLILDEVQECPDARTAVKFLVENGTVDVLETGSLLGVNIHQIASLPVGYEELLPMFPMDFEEFCWAVQTREETLTYLRECYKKTEPVNAALHERMLELFYRYVVIGGMPEVVNAFVKTQNISEVHAIQKRIMDLYHLDIMKYAQDSERIRISNIFTSIPGQLDAKNKRFFLSKVRKTARMERYENSFLWLKEAGVSLASFNVKEVKVPLVLNESRNLFRLFLCDCGLLSSCFASEFQYELLKGNLSVNFGAVIENLFAQEIVSKEIPLFYYDNKQLELDFIIEQGSRIQVLEIKSGANYKSHPSLNRALSSPEFQIDQALVFCKSNVFEENGIAYLPLYMISFLDTQKEEALILKDDINRLFGL